MISARELRARKRSRNQLVIVPETSSSRSLSTVTTAASMGDSANTMTDTGMQATSGPGWIPYEQYKLMKASLPKSAWRKRWGPKKKRKYTRRRTSTRWGSGRYDGHLGPIVITGRGNYFTDKLGAGASAAYRALQRGIPQGTWGRLGSAAGGAMFGAPGAAVGQYLGSKIAGVTGFGDYTIRKNDLLLDEGQGVASFGDLNHGIVVCHREYIKDVTQTQNFTLESFPINPGNPATFPWLSKIAANFDQYEIQGMLFHFRSTASDFGTTTNMAMGTLIMSTDYDSADFNYQSKIEMENAQYSCSGKPSNDAIHAIECDPSISFSPLKYVRTGGVPAGKDIRLYDHGNFQIATTGMPASTGAIGELWVTYKIAFYKPQLTRGDDVLTSIISAPTINGANYLGIAPVLSAANSFPITLTAPFSNIAIGNTLPIGTYFLFIYGLKFTSQSITAGLVTTTSGLDLVESWQTNVNTMDNFQAIRIYRKAAETANLTLGNLTVPTTQTGVRIILTVIDRETLPDAFPGWGF